MRATRWIGAAAVVGGTPEQVEMAGWSVGRFGVAGLALPPVEIRFHDDMDGCGEHLGFYRGPRRRRLRHLDEYPFLTSIDTDFGDSSCGRRRMMRVLSSSRKGEA
jgi:hypothetical protein